MPGDGKTSGGGVSSPFGNGGGAPGGKTGGPSTGNNFVQKPAGSGGPSAGHNFVKDGQKPPGADSGQGTVNPAKTEKGAQPEGTPRCEDSIPAGGIWPQEQIDASIQTPARDLGAPKIMPAHKPFKVSSR
jgi:hypothetical protein